MRMNEVRQVPRGRLARACKRKRRPRSSSFQGLYVIQLFCLLFLQHRSNLKREPYHDLSYKCSINLQLKSYQTWTLKPGCYKVIAVQGLGLLVLELDSPHPRLQSEAAGHVLSQCWMSRDRQIRSLASQPVSENKVESERGRPGKLTSDPKRVRSSPQRTNTETFNYSSKQESL